MINKEPTDFQLNAAYAGLRQMFQESYFQYYRLMNLANALGITLPSSRDGAALQALSGVGWDDMGRDLAQMTRHKVVEMLDLPPTAMTLVETHFARRSSRSAFWRLL